MFVHSLCSFVCPCSSLLTSAMGLTRIRATKGSAYWPQLITQHGYQRRALLRLRMGERVSVTNEQVAQQHRRRAVALSRQAQTRKAS